MTTQNKLQDIRELSTAWSLLHEVSGIIKLVETESRVVVAGGWREGKWGYYLMGTEFHCWEMKRFLEICCTATQT